MPGINAPASPSPEWVRKPVLIAPSADAHREATVTTSKSLSTNNIAATRDSLVCTTRAVALIV